MNIKTAVKYQIFQFKKPIIIYYLVIYLVFILFGISNTSFISQGINSRSGGIEFASSIFIFIAGLNSFKETFYMFLQNSLSRRTLLKSFVLSVIPVTGVMALIDSINGAFAASIFRYDSMYIQLYGQRYPAFGNEILKFTEGFLWYVFAYAMMAMVGYFITVLYYRMNKGLKLLVSIGMPSLFFVILPMIDSGAAEGAIMRSIGNFFSFAWGYKNGFNPYFSMVTCTLIFILFGVLSFLLIRKAEAKEL